MVDVGRVEQTQHALPLHTLDRGVRLLGHPISLDRLFAQLHAGKPITIGVLGASVAQNGGCLDQTGKRCMVYRGAANTPAGFAVRMLRHINRTWPGDHRINNMALDGTGAEHAAHCVVGHVPAEVELVIAEWGSMALHTVRALPSIERIARVLLARPRPPVLLHLSVHEWCSQRVTPRSLYQVGDVLKGSLKAWVYPDTPWAAVEEESTRISRHYGQPSVSVHAALAPHVLAHEPNFALDDITGPDCLHPVNGRHGIEYVEALLVHWFERAHALWHHATSERRDLLHPTRPSDMPASMGLASVDARTFSTGATPLRGSRRSRGLLGLGVGVLPPALHVVNADVRIHTRCYAFMHERQDVRQAIMAPADWCSVGSGSWSTASAPAASTIGVEGAGSQVASCWATERATCPPTVDARAMESLNRKSYAYRRAEAQQTAYLKFLLAPPRHWFYCGMSLGGLRRKISAGLVALVPGSMLRVRVAGWNAADSPRAEMALEHLTSYEGMGVARLECIDECMCEPQVIDAHKTNEIRNVSVFESHRFPVRARWPLALAVRRQRQGGAAAREWSCGVLITLLDQTQSGQHKFKVRSIEVVSALPSLNTTRRLL